MNISTHQITYRTVCHVMCRYIHDPFPYQIIYTYVHSIRILLAYYKITDMLKLRNFEVMPDKLTYLYLSIRLWVLHKTKQNKTKQNKTTIILKTDT